MGQSSNDVFPSAVHLAALDEATNKLLPALEQLEASLAAKADAFADIVKSGRTHLMDAVPVTLGQEFGGYAAQVRLGAKRVRNALPQVAQIPLGGTATGTGLNTHPEFAEKVREKLSADTGLEIHPPEDPFEAQANRDALVELSGALKVVAVSLTKIADDLALMGSGPRAGIGEIYLPELQKGSSIMPGKVNPVMPEVVLQVSAQVIGNDTAITVGGMQGQFELNVRIPLIARNLLQSIQLLSNAVDAAGREVRRRHRAQRGGPAALRRGHARGRHRAQPVHRLRQGGRDRQGRRRRAAARCARSRASTASTRRRSTRRSTCARSPRARRPTRERPRAARRLAAFAARARATGLPAGAGGRGGGPRRHRRRGAGDPRGARLGPHRVRRHRGGHLRGAVPPHYGLSRSRRQPSPSRR